MSTIEGFHGITLASMCMYYTRLTEPTPVHAHVATDSTCEVSEVELECIFPMRQY